MAASEPLIIVDGSTDFSGGVDSTRVTTVASEINPNGLARNQLAWLINGTVRDGGIQPRPSWSLVGRMDPGTSLYQGGYTYEPDADLPYLMHAIGGRIFIQNMTDGSLTDLSAMGPDLTHPADVEQFYFCQAEQFLIIQCGLPDVLPLIWDGVTLRRSIGINDLNVAPGTPGVNEIPAATAMDYYMGRLWYAQGRKYSAGDIVGGQSGTEAYRWRDAVLNVTENPLVLGGDGFTVPTNSGNIRALMHSANIDTSIGQGRLFIFTRKAVYSLQVPVTRRDWIDANSENPPMQTVVQLVNGAVSDRSIVPVNGDLFYQSFEPGIRSLMQAVRDFNQWGNIQISNNLQRVLQFNNRGLMRLSSGITFDSRLIQSQLPKQTPVGIAHEAMAVMDFIPISSFNRQTSPIWEGVYDGLDVLQMFTADFGGLERAFSVAVSREDGSINLWEFTEQGRKEMEDNRIEMVAEFPSFNWGQPFDLKKLVGAELWVDRIYGTVEFTLEYRPDGMTCWLPWHFWKVCSARNSAEDMNNPITYPLVEYGECYNFSMSVPRPRETCAECGVGRPAHVAYQFQPRLIVKGWCRIRGLLLHAEPVKRKLYANMKS